MNKKTVCVDYLGCKLNQAETEALSIDFALAGCETVPFNSGADIYVLNTCTVTHVADRKSRQWLRRVRRRNPSALVIATGCFAERAPGDLQAVDDSLLIFGNRQKMGLVAVLKERGLLENTEGEYLAGAGGIGKTRSLVRIQEGCSNACTYCIVPKVRRGNISRPPEEVISEIKSRFDSGYAEIVLTGTEIGDYNQEGYQLADLVREILQKTDVERLRLSSLQPHHINSHLLDIWQDSRLCRHFHLSLQSGSNTVLRRMNRKYTREEYLHAVRQIQSTLPDTAITTDVIVGFPGETQEEFEQTLAVCKEAGFARIHVFPYSPRPSTKAVEMTPQVKEADKKLREKQIAGVAEEASRAFRKRFNGQVMPVLWESSSGGFSSGLTGNYIRVYLKGDALKENTITNVRILDLYCDGVKGELV